MLSTLFLIAGVITTLWLSLSSVRPFENHGLVLGAMLWCYLVALALKIYAFSSLGNTLSSDHNARVVALLGFISESAGISLLFAAFVTGLAASARPFDVDLKGSSTATGTYMPAGN